MRLIKLASFLCTLFFITANSHAQKVGSHPRLFVEQKDRPAVLQKIETEEWAKKSWEKLLSEINPYVNRHVNDPEWIVSRLAMYWKKGEHYTQCYIKNQNWDYGEGNAPIPTVRLPGMRTWNDYVNVPLEDRIPYNETGDLLGISRSKSDKTPVLIPYKETGHMIRANNMEILQLAEKASFAYFVTQEEKYAKFSADILWTWLLGTYYMNPPLDPQKSSGGRGGYEKGGILGYYDYEVIHDDRQIPAAAIYDFVHDYMVQHPHPHLKSMQKSTEDVAGTVFKRFIEIDLIRGGKVGNWNVNRYKNIIGSMLVLESNDFYADKKGKEYYIPFYTENRPSDNFAGLPVIMDFYNKETGLWPESPGYATGMIPTVLDMGLQLYRAGVNTLAGNPIILKAAMANLGWLDARGNLVVFGDMRGGAADMSSFESLLTYSTWEKDPETAKTVATVIRKSIASGQYDRNKSDWRGIVLNQSLPESPSDLPYHNAAYSEFHKHLILRNGNDEKNGLMFTLYGGKNKSHLTANGLAMQFYGKGWAMAPDASAYESYWSSDAPYHRGILGSNTIVPGYAEGDITINAMDPKTDKGSFYNSVTTSNHCSFADVSASEKRRLVAMVRTSETTGYYVDIFRSNQADNDYIHHNLGNSAVLQTAENTPLALQKTNDLGTKYAKEYSFFTNQQKAAYSNDFNATWTTKTVSPALHTSMWMMGQNNRELYLVDAPPTTLLSNVTPGQVNKSPEPTPTLIVRQNNNNGEKNPFVAVFENYNEGEKAIDKIEKIATSEKFVSIAVTSKNSMQFICNAIDNQLYQPTKGLKFQGTFGIASEENGKFQYLYLGKGKALEKDGFKLEAVNDTVSAELVFENGKYYYSADQAVLIQLKKGKAKEYPAGYHIEIK
ncbi:hypothetical protein [Flavobacterium sp. UMI-01]|uniref:hypothetical protein n=1 Tax=Flavobacterium sp. UMI-01 TaxID=1441053 RepID=UPI001C7DBFCA|nr:hypothetical protein [Flavobacterium sp. UMI-01]GIZ08770.1 hypothetical protein FUMI01_14970 [Flavobacterium sp. UMI-01]